MKKLVFSAILLMATAALSSCGGGSTTPKAENETTTEADKGKEKFDIPKEVDYRMLGNETELKKVFDMVMKKLDTNIRFVEKVDISMSRPAEDNGAPNLAEKNGEDALHIILQQINPSNKNQLYEYRFWSSQQEWEDGGAMTVDVIGGNKETFRLQDELQDLSGLTFDKFNKTVQDGFVKFKDEKKYKYQYVSGVDIKDGEIKVWVRGQLAANDIIKYETYKVKL